MNPRSAARSPIERFKPLPYIFTVPIWLLRFSPRRAAIKCLRSIMPQVAQRSVRAFERAVEVTKRSINGFLVRSFLLIQFHVRPMRNIDDITPESSVVRNARQQSRDAFTFSRAIDQKVTVTLLEIWRCRNIGRFLSPRHPLEPAPKSDYSITARRFLLRPIRHQLAPLLKRNGTHYALSFQRSLRTQTRSTSVQALCANKITAMSAAPVISASPS